VRTFRYSVTTGGTLLAAILIFTGYSAAQTTRPTLTTLYSFNGGSDGADPLAGLVIGSGPSGQPLLYGTTENGGNSNSGCLGSSCGTVFSLTPPAATGDSWTENVLYRFKGGSDGANPEAGLVIGMSKVLYGTTVVGGSSGNGTVFSLTPPASPGGPWTEVVLYSFAAGSDGANSYAPLVSSGGVLYGTTFSGGTGNQGTVFSLTPPASPGDPWVETVLHSFTGYPSDGATPYAGLAIGSGPGGHAVLYGTTYFGGTSVCDGSGCGTVFSLAPPASPGATWRETVLYSFAGGIDGFSPDAGVAIGNGPGGHPVLYGTTEEGGANSCSFPAAHTGCGTAFSLTPPSSAGGVWTKDMLYNFMGGSDGFYPSASLIIAGSGALYGTTGAGGSTNNSCAGSNHTCGTIFALQPPSSPGSPWTETVLNHMTAIEGDAPLAGLAIGGAGVFYGTASAGGAGTCSSGCGTVFSLKP
jgi:uncharacterized repeat protein (TIGR03803 family)